MGISFVVLCVSQFVCVRERDLAQVSSSAQSYVGGGMREENGREGWNEREILSLVPWMSGCALVRCCVCVWFQSFCFVCVCVRRRRRRWSSSLALSWVLKRDRRRGEEGDPRSCVVVVVVVLSTR